MKRPKKNHNWVEDGTDILGDKDYKCSDCGIWASRVLSPWLLGGCLGKLVLEINARVNSEEVTSLEI